MRIGQKTNFKFKVEYVEADPSKGFNFPYIMLLPKKMKQNIKIMVECANSADYEREGQQSFYAQIKDAKGYANYISDEQDGERFNLPYLYQQLNQPIIIPIIERCEYKRVGKIIGTEQYLELDKQGKNTEFYPQQLSRQVMLEREGKFANIPNQVVAMVEDAKVKINKLATQRKQDVQISKKSGLAGWSSSAVFASRMQLICPENFDLCMAFASGGVQPLPLTEYNGQALNYPLGVADFEELFGKPFNIEEYSKAKQITVVGSMENPNQYDIAYNARLFDKVTRDLFVKVYGKVDMFRRQCKIAKILHCNNFTNIYCNVLPHEGHKSYRKENIDEIIQWLQDNALEQQEQALCK